VPILIGARRMAFPRIESLTFWLLMAGASSRLDDLLRRLSDAGRLRAAQRTGGDGHGLLHRFFALVGISMCLLG